LRAWFYAEHISLAAVGGAQPNISDSQLLQCIVPLPPGPEQIAIAAFLDRETLKIDALVAEQRRLVELLKEKRQAVISHAVTQGLNPHAPMKPSGVEWLGDVPEHWEVTRFKRIAELIDGDRSSAYPSDQDIVDEGIPFLSSKNIVGYKFFNTGLRFITQEKFDALLRGKILDNDLAITVRGTIGQVAIYDAKLLGHPTAFINAQMMIMRPIGVTSSFVHSISESHYWQKQLDVASYGTAQQQLSYAILQNIFVVLPPAKERDEISIFLVNELAKFDEAQRAIELLQERRTALISAAVTGQIDVRGLPPAR
ncbi:MAG: restriction endonuclease subunit S, partial [Gemmataceae bacterium]